MASKGSHCEEDDIFSRVKREKEEKAKAKARQVRPGIEDSDLYLFIKSQLARYKQSGYATQTLSGMEIGEAVRSEPRFREATYRSIGPVIKALVEEGFLRRLPPKPGMGYSSTYLF
jgi:hypothetical protein